MKKLRSVLIILVSVVLVTVIFRITEAGVLTPSSTSTVATMHSVEEVYAPLASTTYDSSAVVAAKHGNMLQITKCIIQAMTGGTMCP